jgi:preprotein translocase subunit SecE
MGKVKDEAPASKAASKPTPKGSSTVGDARRRLASFAANLARTGLYKPSQGWYARVWTGVGLGVLAAVGVWRLFDLAKGFSSPAARFAVPLGVAAASAWAIFRLIHYPPFADFLIATEAEMNKVSWTSKADLQRATTVVLVTVVLMSLFLFGVDWIWSLLLQALGVLRFDGGGDFGSTA